MAQDDFLSKFGRKNIVVEGPTETIETVYETEMIIVTDDEPDFDGLLTAEGI